MNDHATKGRPLTAAELERAAELGEQAVADLRQAFAAADRLARRWRAEGYRSEGRLVRRRQGCQR